MKRILASLFLGSLVLGAHAHASITCTNGDIGEVGDAHFQVDILDSGVVQFFPYEGAFVFEAADVVNDAETYSIINKKTVISSEGEEFENLVNALLIMDGTSMSAAVSYNRGPFVTYQLTCSEK